MFTVAKDFFGKVKSCKHLHKKCQRLRKHGVFFSPWDVFVKTPLFFCCQLFLEVSSPKLEAPSPDEVGIGNHGIFVELRLAAILTCPTHGVRVCSTSC